MHCTFITKLIGQICCDFAPRCTNKSLIDGDSSLSSVFVYVDYNKWMHSGISYRINQNIIITIVASNKFVLLSIYNYIGL